MNREADLGFYRRIGVAAFQSLTDDPRAGQKLQRILVTELLKRHEFKVIGAGQFGKVETDVRGKLNLTADQPLDSIALSQIGDQTGAQGIILGVLRDYRMERVGQEEFPMVAFSVQLVDVPTGRIVWDISLGERGGPKFPVFSFGETHTESELATKLCRRALGTLR
ncbi:MAG: hypothetical protein HY304_02180 [candidate division Zixibacteria bacterium]|nr:hypothetical protein [candidate division Zixibacteria bacterium]